MKKTILLFFVLLGLGAAAQPNFTWAKGLLGANGNGIGYGVTVDASGNVYTTGRFGGTIDFDPSAATYNLTSPGNWYDVYISKLDASGNFVWAKRIGGPDTDTGYGIAVDASGNVYTCGTFSGTVDFDPGAAVYNLTSAVTDIFVCKLDGSGNFVWARNMGGASYDEAYGIDVDASGNVYTTGYFSGAADFDPGAGTYTLAASGGGDIFVSKLDVSGNFVWARNMGGNSTSTDKGQGIKADASGNVYTTGGYYLSADFDPGAGSYNLTSNGNSDVFVSKLDASGNFVWAKSMGGSGTIDLGTSIDIDAQGNIYDIGYFNGSNCDFDPGAGVFNLSTSGNNDPFVCKLNSSGNFIWAKHMGGSSVDECYSGKVDASGNIYTTGTYDGTADFDPGPGVFALTTPTLPLAFCNNIFISKLDSSGNFVWAVGMGNTGNEYGQSIALDAANNIYNTGEFQQGTDFDPGVGTFSIIPPNGNTPYVLKLCQAPDRPSAILGNTTICQSATGTYSILAIGQATAYTWALPAGWAGASSSTSISLTAGPASGNLTVSAGNACGLSPTRTVNIQVIQLPTVTVNSGSLCAGGVFTLTAGSAASYTFSSGSNTVAPLGTTSYSVVGSNTAGCISATPAIATIVVYPLPTLTINSGSICLGNSITLNPQGAASYTFLNGGAVVSPAANASYSVTGTSSAGCVSAGPAVSNVTVYAYALPTLTVNSGTICEGDSFTITPTGAASYTYSGGSNVVSPSSSSTYQVIGASTQGCLSNSAVIASVTVNAAPVINVNSGSICTGSSFTINPVGAASYTISGGSSVVSPTANSAYQVSGTSTDGCLSLSSAVANVAVNPLPPVSISSDSPEICIGETVNLSAFGASSYSWSNGATSINIADSPTATTVYTVTGTDGNGCQAKATFTQSVSLCTSIAGMSSNFRPMIFPNPSKGNFTITLDKNIKDLQLSVYNTLGELIYGQTTNEAVITIQLPLADKGIYYLKLTDHQELSTQTKIVIE